MEGLVVGEVLGVPLLEVLEIQLEMGVAAPLLEQEGVVMVGQL